MAVFLLHDDPTRVASLVCSVCGYGIARHIPPGPCPMCRAEDAWIRSFRRAFGLVGAPEPDGPALEAG